MPLPPAGIPTPPYLDDAAVRRLLRLDALLPAMRQALIDLSAGRVLQPLRSVLELPEQDGMLFLKPACTDQALATKLITLYPNNAAQGLPSLLATIVLMDPATGAPLALMDGTWITELRTAAVSAVAADALVSPGPKVVALLGSGALARSHALALRAVREISQIADSSYILSGGQVVASGTPAELRDHPSPVVHQFMDGLADGPVTFHYPAPDYPAQLLDRSEGA